MRQPSLSAIGKFYVFSTAVYITMVLVGWFGLRPLFYNGRDKYKLEAQRRSEIVAANNKLEDLNNIDSDDIKAKLNQIMVAVPSAKDIVGSVTAIRYAAASSGVILDGFSTAPGELGPVESMASPSAASSDTGSRLNYTITIIGTGDQVKRFIGQVESVLPYITVKNVTYGGVDAISEIDMTAEGYNAADKVELGPAQDPLKLLSEREERLLAKIMELSYPPSLQVPGQTDTGDVPVGKQNPFE